MKNIIFTIVFFYASLCQAQWVITNLNTGNISALSAISTDTFIFSSNGVLYKTTNNAKTIDSIDAPGGYANFLAYKSKDTIIAIHPFKGALCYYFSHNGGTTWQSKPLILFNGDTAFKNNPPVFMGFFNQNQGLILGDTATGSFYQTFITNNGGNTWQHLNINALNTINYHYLSNWNKDFGHYIDAEGVFKAPLNAKIQLTISNYGQQWQLDSFGIEPNATMRRVAYKNQLEGIGYLFINGNSTKLLKTNTGGKTWNNLGDTLTDGNRINYVKASPNAAGFYFMQSAKGGMVSYNQGSSWQQIDSIKNKTDIWFNNAESGLMTRVINATKYEMYYFNNPKVGITKHLTGATKARYFVYPNPANQVINFNMPFTEVIILDALGKTVLQATQNNGLNITSLPNGLYWVVAKDEQENTFSQKLIISH